MLLNRLWRSSLFPTFSVSHCVDKPNIIFILADDLGYADLSVYGQREYATPHLDQLAAEGVRFTQAYANSAVCSATRLALITGRYQYRLKAGLEEPIPSVSANIGLPPEHPSLPSLLKSAGYDTALIGKWHLGRPPAFGPLQSGYDTFFGNLGGVVDYFTHKNGVGEHLAPDLYEGTVAVERTGYYTHILADEAQKYVRTRTPQSKPFFLSLHFTAPHWPWEGPNDEHVVKEVKDLFHYDGGTQRTYGEIVQALDAAVGEVLASLKETGQADNTIVIFTSDNGGSVFQIPGRLSGKKPSCWRGPACAHADALASTPSAPGARPSGNLHGLAADHLGSSPHHRRCAVPQRRRQSAACA